MASSDAKQAQENAEESDRTSKNECSRKGYYEQYDAEGYDGGGCSHRDIFGCNLFISGAPSGSTLPRGSVLSIHAR
jgi:hypothetical protein